MKAPTFDVVVIGAGPSGSAAARRAALEGAWVLLVDKAKFPRPKVCGCCINARALATLNELGLESLAESFRGNPLGSIRVWSHGRTVELALSGGAAVSRGTFDSALAQAAVNAGAKFLDAATARVLGPGEVEVRRQGLDPWLARTRMIVCADGLGGRSLSGKAAGSPSENGDDPEASSLPLSWEIHPDSYIGLGAVLDADYTIRPGLIEMACGRAGYVGQVRLEDGRVDVAGAMDPAAVRQAGGPGPAAAAVLDEAGLAVPDDIHQVRWTGTPRLSRRRARAHGPGVLIVGDAAGYVEPFTGEGIAWALCGGLEAGRLAAHCAASAFNGTKNTDRYERQWTDQHRRLIRRRQLSCRLITATLRRPRLRDILVRSLSHQPTWTARMVGRIVS